MPKLLEQVSANIDIKQQNRANPSAQSPAKPPQSPAKSPIKNTPKDVDATPLQQTPSEPLDSVSQRIVNGLKLLANLTRYHDGRKAAVGFLSDGSQQQRIPQLRKLADAFTLGSIGAILLVDANTCMCMYVFDVADVHMYA